MQLRGARTTLAAGLKNSVTAGDGRRRICSGFARLSAAVTARGAMEPSLLDLVQAMHKTEHKAVVYVTGGASQVRSHPAYHINTHHAVVAHAPLPTPSMSQTAPAQPLVHVAARSPMHTAVVVPLAGHSCERRCSLLAHHQPVRRGARQPTTSPIN